MCFVKCRGAIFMLVEEAKKILSGDVATISTEILQEASKIILSELGNAEEKIFEMEKKLIGNLPDEIWKNIEGFDGKYQVSNKGRVKSFINQTERIIGGGINVDGYPVVRLRLENKKSVVKVIHRLVAKAFIGNPKNLPVVNHKDGNKKNNYVENLEWTTIRENTLHAFKLGLMNNHNLQKQDSLTDEEIEYIRKNYKPMDKTFGLKAMMKKFNLSRRVITNIIKNGSAGNCVL